MLEAGDVWRWVVKGLSGVTGMVLKHHEDAASGACPAEWLVALEQNVAILERIVREQRLNGGHRHSP